MCALLAGTPATISADGSWLDPVSPENWNAVSMPLPSPAAIDLPIDPRVQARERNAETEEELALTEAGWRLFAPYQAGWGVKLVQATSGYDGMGRPWGYQVFVFVDGVFAGTLAPEPMNSRFDGALDDVAFFGDRITAKFRRYTPAAPLCCPTGASTVQYRVERTPDGPLLIPEMTTTQMDAPTP